MPRGSRPRRGCRRCTTMRRPMSDDHDLLEQALAIVRAYRDGLDARPPAARAGVEELRSELAGPLADAGVDGANVLAQLARAVEPGLVATSGPRWFGFVDGGTLPIAVAADSSPPAGTRTPDSRSSRPRPRSSRRSSPAGCSTCSACRRGLGRLRHRRPDGATSPASPRRAGRLLRRRRLGRRTSAACGSAPALRVLARRAGARDDLSRRCACSASDRRSPSGSRPTGRAGCGRRRSPARSLAREAPTLDLRSRPATSTPARSIRSTRRRRRRRRTAAVLGPRRRRVRAVGGGDPGAAAPPPRRRERADSWSVDAPQVAERALRLGDRDHPRRRRAPGGDGDRRRPTSSTRRRAAATARATSPRPRARARGFVLYATLRALGRDGVAAIVEGCCEHARHFAELLGARRRRRGPQRRRPQPGAGALPGGHAARRRRPHPRGHRRGPARRRPAGSAARSGRAARRCGSRSAAPRRRPRDADRSAAAVLAAAAATR